MRVISKQHKEYAREIWFEDPDREFWPYIHKMQVDVYDLYGGGVTRERNVTLKKFAVQDMLVLRYGGHGDVVLLDHNPNNLQRAHSIWLIRSLVTTAGVLFKTPQRDLDAYDELVRFFVGD